MNLADFFGVLFCGGSTAWLQNFLRTLAKKKESTLHLVLRLRGGHCQALPNQQVGGWTGIGDAFFSGALRHF